MMSETFCIYLTTNKINGKRYVGQHKYKTLYDGYIGSGSLLKKALKKYGKDNFELEYLETDLSKEDVDWWEQWYINVLNPEYNIGGQGARYRDTIDSQEHKLRLSSIKRFQYLDPAYHEKISKAHKGIPTGRKGKKLEEYCRDPISARLRMSESHKGKIPFNKGKKMEKPSPLLGKKFSEDHKRKLRKAKLENPVRYWKGKSFEEEHKRKLSESHKGKNNTKNAEYKKYKENGGTMKWNEFQRSMKNERR